METSWLLKSVNQDFLKGGGEPDNADAFDTKQLAAWDAPTDR